VQTVAKLWRIFNTPSRFDGDPYGGFLNQWGHYTGGAASFMMACGAWFIVDGEMPPRYIAAGVLVLAYALLIEVAAQGWRGLDSVEDTLFVAMGAITVASSVEEAAAVGWLSQVTINVGGLMASIAFAFSACLVYAATRIR
jgi:di/tricarboxylate transporter